MIPEEWECVPDGKWRPTEVDFLVSKLKNASGIYETNKMQAWGLAIPSLLSGNSEDLPDIQLHHVPLYINPSPAMNIMVRAKGSPTDGLNFFLFIFPNSTNGTADFHMPIVVLGTNNNGYSVFPTLDQLRELKK
jgi:hypothetical protein